MAMKKGELDSITITRPDDWHLHLRDGEAMRDVIGYSARQFGRAIIMPNLKPPVITTEAARLYQNRIKDALRALRWTGVNAVFEPLMTLYLTDNTSPDEIDRAKESGLVYAVKLYPAGATTNSDFGVTKVEKAYPALERMERVGMPLLVHGEVTDPSVDVFDREAVFLEQVFKPLRDKFSALKIVLEHITKKETVNLVFNHAALHYPTAATITAHHLLENRNAIFKGGIRPHYYCLPVLKRENDRQALLVAATSNCPVFFLGTDSAPHRKYLKENECGCAGCFTALHALELYAEAFDSAGALDKLESFASYFGADFYGLPRNTGTVTLVRKEWRVPMLLEFDDDVIVPFRAGETMKWKVERMK